MLCEAGKEKPVALATADVCVLIRFSFDKPPIMKQTLQKRKVWLYYCTGSFQAVFSACARTFCRSGEHVNIACQSAHAHMRATLTRVQKVKKCLILYICFHIILEMFIEGFYFLL